MTPDKFDPLFPDDETCLQYLFQHQHVQRPCPKCRRICKYHLQSGSSHFVCQCGGHQISPKVGTIFEKSDTDLMKWFYAILRFSVRKRLPATELQPELGVTYKTAWRMAHKIRYRNGIAPGDPVVSQRSASGIVVRPLDVVIAEVQPYFSDEASPGVRLSDELGWDRRAKVKREQRD